MKSHITNYFKEVLKDRAFMGLMAFIAIIGLVYCLSVGLSIQPSDTQLYTHYTAFGEAHFYRGRWQYYFAFVVFGLVVTIVHIALMVKLFTAERRRAAMAFGWVTVLLLLVIWAYTTSVIGIPH